MQFFLDFAFYNPSAGVAKFFCKFPKICFLSTGTTGQNLIFSKNGPSKSYKVQTTVYFCPVVSRSNPNDSSFNDDYFRVVWSLFLTIRVWFAKRTVNCGWLKKITSTKSTAASMITEKKFWKSSEKKSTPLAPQPEAIIEMILILTEHFFFIKIAIFYPNHVVGLIFYQN